MKLPILKSLEHALVDAVCDSGVDINKAVSNDHLAPMLAFVCGLGLRKADHLRRTITKTVKFIDSRMLLLERKILPITVWNNATGFLKICDDSSSNRYSDEKQYIFDCLDNTRIHPECYITYTIVQKIVCDALEVDNNPSTYTKKIKQQMGKSKEDLLVKARKHPEWVDLWEKGFRPTGEYEEINKLRDGRTDWRKKSVELEDAMSLLILEDYASEIESTQGK